MTYHSRDGREFVGFRALRGGQKQIVYDAISGERIVVTIKSATTSAIDIDAAMKEGIQSPKVFTGVLTALAERNIRFDLSR